MLSFYRAMKENGDECIGCGQAGDYDRFLSGMRNRRDGRDLPVGWVQEDFYLCYAGQTLAGVFSLKRELTDFLLHYGGHIGYAVRPSMRGRGIATAMLKQGAEMARALGFSRLLCVCNEDNRASELVILRSGGVLENTLYDPDEKVVVKRYWIAL